MKQVLRFPIPQPTVRHTRVGFEIIPANLLRAELSRYFTFPEPDRREIKAQAGGCSAVQGYSLTIDCPTIAVNPASLSNGTVGSSYNANISATPPGNYQFKVTAGELPAGLSLHVPTGALSGTPTTAGLYSFTFTAKRAGNCTESTAYTLLINPAACPLSITLPALPNGKAGQLYVNSVIASPSGSYSYAVTMGKLPPGVSLISSFGLLIGTPTRRPEMTAEGAPAVAAIR
jgi:hypothetical protein